MSHLSLSSLLFLALCTAAIAQRIGPRGLSINCGSFSGSEVDGVVWLPDSAFVEEGISTRLSIPGLHPVLSVVRSFPFRNSEPPRQFCYVIPAFPGAKYLVRTSFFYGGVGGKRNPPVFDLIVDGTLWAVVNTTADYARNFSSYYEGIYKTRGRIIRLCLGGNDYTDSDPFISSIETIILEESVYNSTDFDRYALALVARNSFGQSGSIFRYPNDRFNRIWHPFVDQAETIRYSSNVSNLELWNLPPQSIFEYGLVVDGATPRQFQWPLLSLPNASFYIALYFAATSSRSSEILDVSINGVAFSRNLRVTSSGACVFSSQWVLSGPTVISLAASDGSEHSPLVNGGEIFSLLKLGGLTLSRDVFAMEAVKRSLVNPPSNWAGDPCLPVDFSWTGVTCAGDSVVRVIGLNLTGMNISGTISPEIAVMSGLAEIILGNNSLSGEIPDLNRLRNLEKLHLQNNNFTGPLPSSLADLSDLRELYVENNRLRGPIPSGLRRNSLNFRYLPGNNLS
ncbi:leucine-rich repeat (LRR) family protein [Wolffia australiana]